MSAIVVTGADLAPQALELLSDYDIVYAGKTPNEADLVALCRAHDPVAIIVRYGSIGSAVMDAAPSLKVISKHGSGTDTIDKVAAQARGIEVLAASGANAAAVAEQALAMLLACAKSVVTLDLRMHAGHWDKATHKSLELGGRTIGLIGLGAIGQRFARMVDALDMRILGFDPFAARLPSYVTGVDLATIWRESDVISL
ncbi:MAG: 3-phosphoglycerate dehydrogenase, partial [Gammaproteobacteria bacterium]|nr:3-phosphoglycerate dehydrogenase [Gammaproteobacteria bacterium]